MIDSRRKFPLILSLSVISVFIAAVLSISLGAVSLHPFEIAQTLYYALSGREAASLSQELRKVTAIAWNIRLPRTIAALFAGSALAISGAAVQGVFRNPMASPDILGISAGSSFGAVLVISLGWNMIHPLVLPGAAFFAALMAALFVYVIGSNRGRAHMLFVLLAGLAVSSLLNGLVSSVLLFSDRYEMSLFLFWTMGGLEGTQFDKLLVPVPVISVGIIILMTRSRQLNLLSLGDEQAHSLGLSVEAVKLTILSVSALLTAMAIALAGPIGFVGLLVPHMMRMLFGSDHRYLLPVTAMGGAVFLALSDIIGRILMPPYEIKTGIITSILGAPYFIFLIVRYQRSGRLV